MRLRTTFGYRLHCLGEGIVCGSSSSLSMSELSSFYPFCISPATGTGVWGVLGIKRLLSFLHHLKADFSEVDFCERAPDLNLGYVFDVAWKSDGFIELVSCDFELLEQVGVSL